MGCMAEPEILGPKVGNAGSMGFGAELGIFGPKATSATVGSRAMCDTADELFEGSATLGLVFSWPTGPI